MTLPLRHNYFLRNPCAVPGFFERISSSSVGFFPSELLAPDAKIPLIVGPVFLVVGLRGFEDELLVFGMCGEDVRGGGRLGSEAEAEAEVVDMVEGGGLRGREGCEGREDG